MYNKLATRSQQLFLIIHSFISLKLNFLQKKITKAFIQGSCSDFLTTRYWVQFLALALMRDLRFIKIPAF